MEQTWDEIAELADDIGKSNIVRGKVNVAKIAKSKGIKLIYGHYGNCFLGILVHSSRKFYIHLNLDLLPDKKSARTRFTIAHELGHYFIDSHRTMLIKGISLSNANNSNIISDKHIERQANHFASHLLMPKSQFIRSAKKLEPGLSSILLLKKKFDTSIEATALHYLSLNLTASIIIKWRSDYSFHYTFFSKSFSLLTGIKESPSIKFKTEYLIELVKNCDENCFDYCEKATPISRWISTVIPESTNDFIGLEQTIKLGDYGGLTLLTFHQ